MTEGNLAYIQDMDPAQVFSLTGDRRIQSVISKLRFLAKVQMGEKMNTRELFVRDNDSVLQRIVRTVRNYTTWASGSDIVESKEATLNFIENSIDEAITLIAFYRRTDEPFNQRIADIIAKNLEESKDGIHESIKTYKSDRKFISSAESIMQTLEARVDSLRTKGYMMCMTDKPFMPPINSPDYPVAGATVHPTETFQEPATPFDEDYQD